MQEEYNKLGDDEMALYTMIPPPGGVVNLNSKMLRDSHVPALLEAVEEYEVEGLSLFNNQFGVGGARALAAGLATNKTLTTLK